MSVSRMAAELLEKLVDDAARLKASGKVAEAAEKEAQHAKLYKEYKREGVLDEAPADVPVETPSDKPNNLAEALSTEPLDTAAIPAPTSAKKMALGAGGALAAGSLAYQMAKSPDVGPVKDDGLVGGQVPGALKPETAVELKAEAPVTASSPDMAPKKPKSIGQVASKEDPNELESLMTRLGGMQASRETVNEIPYTEERNKAKADLAEARNKQDYMSLGDRIGRSLVQMGAAQQGLRSNVDLSGIKGEPIDTSIYGKRGEEDFNSANADINARQKQAEEAVTSANKAKEEQLKESKDLLGKDYFNRLKEKGEDRRQAQRLASDKEIAGLRSESAEERAHIQAEARKASGGGASSRAEAKANEKQSAGQRQLDRLLTESAAEGITTKDKKRKMEEANKLFAQIYPDAKARERLFTKQEGGFFSSPEVDIAAVKAYNDQQMQGKSSTPGSDSGTVTFKHKGGATKTYKADDPAVQALKSNPDFTEI